MSLLDATVKLYLKREREQVDRFFNALETGETFENTNSDKIWSWGCKRYKRAFSDREYEIREGVKLGG